MSNDKNDFFDHLEEKNPVNFKQLFSKYLSYWGWFVASLVITLFVAFAYLRYAKVIYKSEAKVKLLTDKENSNFSLDVTKLFNKSTVNLENEISLFKSVQLSEQVVKNLNLNVEYYYKSTVTTNQVYDLPFQVSYSGNNKDLNDVLQFTITVTSSGYEIVNNKTEAKYKAKGYFFNGHGSEFPIIIKPVSKTLFSQVKDKSFIIFVKPLRRTALELSQSFAIDSDGKDSDILSISLQGTNGKHSEKIINNLISVFEADGVADKQEVSQRTISFVDDRFVYLKKELESIEISKKEYKKNNNLSFIQEDAGSTIIEKNTKEQASFQIESQILLADLLKNSIESQKALELLPSDIGIQNTVINKLVSEYNATILEYQKTQVSAGVNNPSIKLLLTTISNQKVNIINSVKGYKQQLKTTLAQSEFAQRKAERGFTSLPEKEKILRSIERQQNLKESLYLLLLQKKEEASINLAITIPNTKIIDYAITESFPVSPQKSKIYLAALLLGLILPFGALFFWFKLDDKVHDAIQLESITTSVPVLAELPSLTDTKDSKMQNIEAFRTLVNNANFITPISENKQGSVYFVTSSIKGEGKTHVSYNFAVANANLNKKVILIGIDFRNPQLHKHIEKSRSGQKGFSNYLHDPKLQWQDLINRATDNGFEFDILLSGDIPPNPTLLLSNPRFGSFVEEIKNNYDVVIFDTPPTLLVTDTLIVSKFADATLYVVRSGLTEKKLINYSVKLKEDKKIINMGYVINDVNFNNSYGYGYGYNYGYGYGYGADVEQKKPWYKKLFKNKKK